MTSIFITISLFTTTLTFDMGDLTILKQGCYDRISMCGCTKTEKVGQPELSERLLHFVMPHGMAISKVRLENIMMISLDGKFIPYPFQPYKRLGNEEGPFISLECTDIYPSSIVEIKREDVYFGERIVTIAVHPLLYHPEDSSISFIQNIDFSFSYKPVYIVSPERSVYTRDRINRFLSIFESDWSKNCKERFSVLKMKSETELPSYTSDRIDLCLITSDSLKESFMPLIYWKSRKGIRSTIRTLEWIESYYTGCDVSEKIRNFIKDAYQKWGLCYIVIGGGINIIPVRYAFIQAEYNLGELIPTDMYYACLDGDWDANDNGIFGESEDDVDMGYDVFIGRLPVQTREGAESLVEKLLLYEKSPLYGYQKKIMLVGSELFSGNGEWGLDGMEHCEDIADELPDDFTVSKMYEYYGYPTREEFLDSVVTGYNMVYAVCHGYIEDLRVMLSRWPPIWRSDWDSLINPSGFMYLTTCWTNSYDSDNFCAHYIESNLGGGIGIIASTRSDFPECSRPINRAFFKAIFTDSLFSPAEADAASKITGGTGVWWRWENYALNYLGDPEMYLWTDFPDTLSVVYDDTVDVGQQIFDICVTDDEFPFSGAYICVSNENVYATAYTDESGVASFELIPEVEGMLSIVVTAHNYIPYEGELHVEPEQPYIIIKDFSPEILSSGDSISFLCEFMNSGGSDAWNISARGYTNDSLVNLIDTLFIMKNLSQGESDTVIASILINKEMEDPTVYLAFNIYYNDTLSSRDSTLLYIYYPEIFHYGHSINEISTDTFSISIVLRNSGFGEAESLTATLSSSNIIDSIYNIDLIEPDTLLLIEDAFSYTGGDSVFSIVVIDGLDRTWVDTFIVRNLLPPEGLYVFPGETSMRIFWQPVDYAIGYNIYRSDVEETGYIKLNSIIQSENSVLLDQGLLPWTGYYYRVSAIDSFMNESGLSAHIYGKTNPVMKTGWPKKGPKEKPFWVVVCADIDKTHTGKEVFCGCDDGRLYGWHCDGSTLLDEEEFANLEYPVWGRSAVGDIDADGEEEIIIAPFWASSCCSIYVFNGEGQIEQGFPVLLPDAGVGLIGSPVLQDIYGNGFLEIIVLTFSGNIYLIEHTGSVNLFSNVGVNPSFISPSIADIDGDDTLEIIAGGDSLYVWNTEGDVIDSFPVWLEADVIVNPSIADIDLQMDGLEIITATEEKLWVLNRFGRSLTGWPQEYSPPPSEGPGIAVGDVTGNGEPDIVMVCFDQVTAWNKEGMLLSGWPVHLRMRHRDALPASPPLIADVDGDGNMEVVVGGTDGAVYSIEADGSFTPGFPVQTYHNIKRSPVIDDIDDDGMNELLVTNYQGTYLYVWEVEGDSVEWGSARHDRWNTGLYGFVIPEITEVTMDFPYIDCIFPPYPNPMRGIVDIRYQISSIKNVKIKVYDVCGRAVKTLLDEPREGGTYTLKWSGVGENGNKVANGVYFIVLDTEDELKTSKLVYIR
ncbi:T9SS type A sorting domain-containing protein [candidate division WOR-3 bacterium]|nr:T9SS type A sorting domain-containing protein [candidate division WOR-3 bacterium]